MCDGLHHAHFRGAATTMTSVTTGASRNSASFACLRMCASHDRRSISSTAAPPSACRSTAVVMTRSPFGSKTAIQKSLSSQRQVDTEGGEQATDGACTLQGSSYQATARGDPPPPTAPIGTDDESLG
jgi:hypothetical protein